MTNVTHIEDYLARQCDGRKLATKSVSLVDAQDICTKVEAETIGEAIAKLELAAMVYVPRGNQG